MRTPLLPFLLVAALGCTDGAIIDDWGPPAGYTTVAGTVRDTAGAVKSGAMVLITQCDPPIGGLLGQATSAANGSYTVSAALPPVGLMPALDLDTLHVYCTVGAGSANAPLAHADSITVHFAATPEEVVPIVRDLTFR